MIRAMKRSLCALLVLLAPLVHAQSFVAWEARAERFRVTAGERSVFELSDARLLELAEAEIRGADLRIADSTIAHWRRILERCRAEGRVAVTLSTFWLTYRYTEGRAGYDRMAVSVEGGAVLLLAEDAPDWLAEHEAGHARLLEGSLDLGERIARLAFDEYDGGEAPRSAEAAIRATAEAMIPVLTSLENALDEAYDRVSGHRESGEMPEELLEGAADRIEEASDETDDPGEMGSEVVEGLSELDDAGELDDWSSDD